MIAWFCNVICVFLLVLNQIIALNSSSSFDKIHAVSKKNTEFPHLALYTISFEDRSLCIDKVHYSKTLTPNVKEYEISKSCVLPVCSFVRLFRCKNIYEYSISTACPSSLHNRKTAPRDVFLILSCFFWPFVFLFHFWLFTFVFVFCFCFFTFLLSNKTQILNSERWHWRR